MKATKIDLEGVYVFETSKYRDKRGTFIVPFNLKEFKKTTNFYADFVQDNLSTSKKGVLRGLHYQVKNPQGKFVKVIKGSVQDVIVDLRQRSPTFGKSFSIVLSSKNNLSLWVPPGFAHGFLSLSEGTQFFYKVTNDYSPENERTLLWNDPELNINWQIDDPILSEKDVNGKVFKECEKYV
jgi:dTDP-4-dehydrorhamnose 3,5-epimerase